MDIIYYYKTPQKNSIKKGCSKESCYWLSKCKPGVSSKYCNFSKQSSKLVYYIRKMAISANTQEL